MKIAILGDFDDSENYPNTRHLLAGVKQDARFEVVALSAPAASARNLYRSASNPFKRLLLMWGVLWRALRVSSQIQGLDKSACDVIYVPYPATIILFLVSWLPRRSSTRPVLVMDCFISLYDTVVNDRGLLQSGGVAARLLAFIERRAVRLADIVITDTLANARFLGKLLGGDGNKWQALNLCINESLFRPAPVVPRDTLNVLFVGSFVPLQGADVVASAAIALRHRHDIRFHLLGDGQTADRVEAVLAQHASSVVWERGWHPITQLAAKYAEADICLGVFGATAKAARVLPYKVYMALACGKPVINCHIEAPLLAGETLPVIQVPANDASALAAKIVELADDAAQRQALATAGRRYYEQHLSNSRAVDGFYRILAAAQTASRGP